MRRLLCLALLSGAACVDETFPPSFGVYQVSGLVAEVTGETLDATFTGTVPAGLLLARTAFSGPLSQPDFITSSAIPNCLATAFTGEDPAGGNEIDAGDLSFDGLSPTASPLFVQDILDTTPTPEEVVLIQTGINCVQGPDDFADPGAVPPETGLRHDCGLPSLAAFDPRQSFLGPGTSLVVSATGGSQSGAFAAPALTPPPVLFPTANFNLLAVDTRQPVVAEWIPVAAPLAMIEIVAVRADRVGAQILCLELMTSGRREIPAGALALAPEPTPTAPVVVFTSVAAVNFETRDEGWGSYVVGLGRGRFGSSLMLANP